MKKQNNANIVCYATQKGITLIALVITIVILLILVGISISALTDQGLFTQASIAKRETKRGQVIEWLNLKLIEEQANNTTGTADEIIKATRQNVIKHQNELEKIGKNVIIEEVSTEEDGKLVDIYFYVQVDGDVYKIDIKGAKFIGEIREFPPVIKLENIVGSTNSIAVAVSTKRNEGGTIEFYIKKEGDTDYKLKETKKETDASYTYTGLEQNKKYNIKIVATSAENGQTAEILIDKTLGSVPDLAEGNVIFTYSIDGKEIDKETWVNKTVTVTASTEIKGYTLQTSKDGKTWDDTVNQKFTETGQMHAVLYDGTNYGNSISVNVINVDIIKPTVNVTSTTKNSITFTGTDAADKNGKASGVAGYIVQLSSVAAPTENTSGWISYNGTSKTVNNLEPGKTYNVYIKDNTGNVSEAGIAETEKLTYLYKTNDLCTSVTGGWNSGKNEYNRRNLD